MGSRSYFFFLTDIVRLLLVLFINYLWRTQPVVLEMYSTRFTFPWNNNHSVTKRFWGPSHIPNLLRPRLVPFLFLNSLRPSVLSKIVRYERTLPSGVCCVREGLRMPSPTPGVVRPLLPCS